jgi:hypothetical protein
MWAVKRSVVPGEAPPDRTTVHFRFTAVPKAKRCWWLVLEPPAADLCLSDPGYGVDLIVRSDPVALASVYVGDRTLATALRARDVELVGPQHLVRDFPRWFGLTASARA